jgi:hypothetical protein
MLLDPADAKQFFKIQLTLLAFANQQLGGIVEDVFTNESRLKVREALYNGRLDLIELFAAENPYHLPNEEIDIIRSWRHAVPGEFFVMRQMKKYAVFLSIEKPGIAYAVVALTQPFEELIPAGFPAGIKTVLLPFKGRIIYDGSMTHDDIDIDPHTCRLLNDTLREVKALHGMVTSLPASGPTPGEAIAPKAKSRAAGELKGEAGQVAGDIIAVTDQFCREHLNEEYAELCRALAAKLARKRPSPLISGKPATWAGAIVRTIGWVNFLDDPSQKPHMALRDLDRAFGISGSTGQTKSAQIRKMLKIDRMDPEWTLPSKLGDNPLAWMIEVNGFIMDARRAPPAIQEEAFLRGLIPYVPGPPVPVEKPAVHAAPAKASAAPPPPKKEDVDQMKLF